jgi:transcriptional regulator of acetoin/glycerol metabolism
MSLAKPVHAVQYAAITEEDKKSRVFHALRTIRTNTRYKGRRDKKTKEAEDAKK